MTPPIPASVLDQHSVVVGKTGSGKTFTIKGLVERLLAEQRRVCVIDPTGVWWGLRLKADGETPGFQVIVFGGDFADVPIDDKAGALLAELLVERNLPCVIDLSTFTNAGRTRFMRDFAGALYRKSRRAFHLILDEADEFAPQQALPDQKAMLGEIDRIVRRGRARGFRVTLITQRPAVLHKNVMAQCNTLIAMRLTSPQDRRAVEDWVKGHGDEKKGRELLRTLAGLQVGTGWLWAPDEDILERVKFPPIETYDSSRTPEEGDDVPVPANLGEVDLGDLQARLTQPEDDKKASKRQKPDTAALDRIWEEGHDAGYQQGVDSVSAQIEEIERLAVRIIELVKACDLSSNDAPEPKPPGAAPVVRKPRSPRPVLANGELIPAGRKLLTVLAQHHPIKLSWQQTATLAGLKARGGTFNHARKLLRENGYVEEGRDVVNASNAGLAFCGDVETTDRPTVEVWIERLPAPAKEMLSFLHGRKSSWTGREAMAQALGKTPRGGHWNNGISTLRRNGLIEERGDDLRCADIIYGVSQ